MKRARLSGVLAKVAKRSSASRCGENIRCPRATSWRIAAGQVGGRGRNAASGRGVAIAGPSPTLPAFSFFSFFFFSAFPSSSDGSDRWWSRGPERHPSDRECPAGTPARSLPSAPGRCFSPSLLPMAGPGRASRGENP